MKLVLLSLVAALPGLAQFQSMEITFTGIGCTSCVESLPARVQRLRGVESATVDAARGILSVKLAERNRVRLEQVRDMIEQDGTKAAKASVRVKGDLAQQNGKWVLQPSGLSSSYEVESGAQASLAAGVYVLTGDVAKLRPESGTVVIRAIEFQRAE